MTQRELKQGQYYLSQDDTKWKSTDTDTLFLFKVTRNQHKKQRVYYRWWRNTGQTDLGKCWLPFYKLVSEITKIQNISEEKAKMLINLWKTR